MTDMSGYLFGANSQMCGVLQVSEFRQVYPNRARLARAAAITVGCALML
jgi:hypothetical protein